MYYMNPQRYKKGSNGMKLLYAFVLSLATLLLFACSNDNNANNYFDFPLNENGYPNWNNILIDDEIYELGIDKNNLSNNTDINYKINEDKDIITIVIPKRMPIVNWIAEYDNELLLFKETILQAKLDADEPIEGESGELQKFVFKYNSKIEETSIKLILKNVDTTDDIIYSIIIHALK